MADSTSGFIQELHEHLDKRLPPHVVLEITSEYECDLRDRLEAFEELGIIGDEAESHAVAALGDPPSIARNLIETYAPVAGYPWADRLMLITAAILVFSPWALILQFDFNLTNDLAYASLIVLAIFSVASLFSSRFHWKGILASTAAAFVLTLVGVSATFTHATGPGVNRIYGPLETIRLRQGLPGEIAWLKAYVAGREPPARAQLMSRSRFDPRSLHGGVETLAYDVETLAALESAARRPRWRQLLSLAPFALQGFLAVFAACAAINLLGVCIRRCWYAVLWRLERFPTSRAGTQWR